MPLNKLGMSLYRIIQIIVYLFLASFYLFLLMGFRLVCQPLQESLWLKLFEYTYVIAIFMMFFVFKRGIVRALRFFIIMDDETYAKLTR